MPKKALKTPVSAERAVVLSLSARRSYMGKDDRRRMLLEHASQLVESNDWSELTMSALATHAGVSRQLVYQHFQNVEALLVETITFVFTDLWNHTAAVVDDKSLNLHQAIVQAAELSLNLPEGQADALAQVISGTARSSPELIRFNAEMRSLLCDLWTPRLARELGLKKPAARSLLWMVMMAFWGLRQLIRDGAISRKQGLEQFSDFARCAVAQGKPA